ncbi:hypothetical protein [Pseudomonas prosekii]|uniref:hypothetical protein n=1 Tax=Pseudomonas prosekii TaxID=1148509 RepID=UPI0011EB1109|nr:hypothetical protein [Pseudomonas prosekii]
MLKIAAATALAALITGCSTSPVSFEQAKPVPGERVLAYGKKPAGPYGTIQVARDTGFVGGGCYVAIHVDGKPVARIDTGEAVSLFVPVGDHLVGLGADERGAGLCSWSGSLKEQSAALKAGQVKRFRIGGDTNVGLDIRPSSI